MSDMLHVVAVVEGRTEQTFVERILAPQLGQKNIFISATQISKSGQKGGIVKFTRAEKDIGRFLKQRNDIIVTQFFDYYGLKEWPKLDDVKGKTHLEVSNSLNEASVEYICREYGGLRASERYIPFLAMHEFEALLFSDAAILAESLSIDIAKVQAILDECGEPEKINNNRDTAPSKRLDALKPSGAFKKTVEGIAIAERIGVDKMRECCPLFNEWLIQIESKLN